MKKLSSNLIDIAKILSDLDFHDGDSIGKKLGITRSAVWKAIKKLEEYGIGIASIKNKGYQLSEPLLLINQPIIEKEFTNVCVEVFESLDSTNTYLKNNLDINKTCICLAETQTNARGRMQRSWHAPFGKNIYLTVSYTFKKDVSELNGLSLVIGIAILNALKEIGITEIIKLKWPNDGIFEGNKLFGILVELLSESFSNTTAIIGIGINVNMMFDDNKITQNWTSLQKICGKSIDRNKLIISLIHNLNYVLETFEKYGLKEFISKWFEHDALINKSIKLNLDNKQGIARGINEQGHLLIELEDGTIESFASGETSIIKN